jgi:hypothetical protein
MDAFFGPRALLLDIQRLHNCLKLELDYFLIVLIKIGYILNVICVVSSLDPEWEEVHAFFFKNSRVNLNRGPLAPHATTLPTGTDAFNIMMQTV